MSAKAPSLKEIAMSAHTGTHADTLSVQQEYATPAAAPTPEPAPSTAFFAGNPAAVGVPVFVAGSVALGLVLIGYVPPDAVGASIPIIFAATGLGLLLATAWSAAVGATVVAAIFGIFAGFWLSYAALVLGLTHNWFAITAAAAVHTQGLFLITWLVIIGTLTLATLRLPLAFTVLFVLIDATLAIVLAATINASTDLSKAGGVGALAFAAVGAYIFLGVCATATGGKALPLGRPVLR
jgi:succinate-acetate transporter protein